MVFKTIKFVASKHFITLKPKYFTKPWYFSKTPKILCIQTDPFNLFCKIMIISYTVAILYKQKWSSNNISIGMHDNVCCMTETIARN